MKIQDIEMLPTNESVVAHLQDRLREAWSNDRDRKAVHDLLDAISLCLNANGYPKLQWDKTAQAWVPIASV